MNVAPMTENEIEAYISTDEPYDKAGAYGIQGLFGKFIEGIEGTTSMWLVFPFTGCMKN